MSENETPPTTDSSSGLTLSRAQLVTVGVALVGPLLAIFFGTLLLGTQRGWFGGDSAAENPAEPTTAASEAGEAEGETGDPSGEDVIVVFDGSNTLSVDLDPPNELSVSNKTYTVTAEFVPQNGAWPDSGRGDTAEWAFGTIINYVFALPEDQENLQLLESLVPGQRIAVVSAAGTNREFLVTGRETTGAPNEVLLAQTRPQLTLLWQGEIGNDVRTVVYADYILPQDPVDEVSASAGVSIGESAQLGNTRLTVTSADLLVESGSAPPGFAVYLVEFSLENLGSQALDTGLFRLALIDELGNQYSLNTAASQEGINGVLSGFVDAGSTRRATAGYQIPAGLASETLRWVVTRVDAPGTVEVSLPFSAGASAASDLTIQLQQADISSDGTSLILTGQITNLGSGPVTITEADLSLSSAGSIFLLSSVNPGLPWSIQPGLSQPFALTYQRPTGESATLTILNQSFELNGLR